MYRVLLPIDENDERATAQAQAVEHLPGAEEVVITLLHVYKGVDESGLPNVMEMASTKAVLAVLDEYAVEGERAFGDPAQEIVRMAEKIGADLIVLGGRKRSSLGSFLFGSVSHAVTLHVERPVMITGSHLEVEARDKPPSYGEVS